ncbi:UNVERIFIED_CONTAM: hypothetical protein IGO34_28275, partial [Salmonella enterica subsp. enterica serovar Weltevreden]
KTAADILEVNDPSELIGAQLMDFFSDDTQRELAYSRMDRAVKGEEQSEYSYRIRTARHSEIEVDLKTVPFIYNGKKCVQTIISNISDVKKL